jgi:hypothetical protein
MVPAVYRKADVAFAAGRPPRKLNIKLSVPRPDGNGRMALEGTRRPDVIVTAVVLAGGRSNAKTRQE